MNMGLHALKPDIRLADPANEARKAQSLRIRQGIARTLRQAVDLQELAYDAAMDLKGNPGTSEAADIARSRAMAVSATVKAWETAVDRVRIWRGKPLPSNPRNAQPKPSKQVSFNPFKEQ